VLLTLREGVVTLLASVAIMLDYEAVLKRRENLAVMGATIGGVNDFLDGLARLAEPAARGFSHAARDPRR
jgi:SNF family Na+-dependent transporter